MNIEQRKIGLVIPYERNAREGGAVEKVAQSITEFGWRQPIVVDADGVVIAGHTRLAAAKKLGLTEVPVLVAADLTAEQVMAYRIADNRSHEGAAWVAEILGAELRVLQASGFDTRKTGLTNAEMRRALAVAASSGGKTDSESDKWEQPKRATSRRGDVWDCGPHTVACLDSLADSDEVRAIMPKGAHLVACDPPYAIYGSSTGIGADIADDKMVRPFFRSVMQLAAELLPWFGHCYLCCDWRSWPSIWEAAKDAKSMEPKNCIVWDKGGSGMGANYANAYELVGYFAKIPPAGAMRSGRKRGQRAVYLPNLKRFPRPRGAVDRQHNAAKPVPLFQELIEASCDPGNIVFDPFCGSGTTLIAAHRSSRIGVTSEIDPKWVDVAVKRWAAEAKDEPRLRATGESFSVVEAARAPKQRKK